MTLMHLRLRSAALVPLLLLLAAPVTAQRRAPTPAGAGARMNAFVDSLLARMTVQEKLGQLTQLPGPMRPEDVPLIKAGRLGSYLNVNGAAAMREVQRVAVEQSRLKVPLLFGHDVIHGYRTVFPVPLAEASSWDPALVEATARMAAEEATAAGIDWTFAPMVDIARDPRWGRIVEGSGEDPYLGSVLAAARVRGFQGRDLADSTAMMATVKHFGAYGGAEGGRDYNTVDVSERTLRETYLPPYRAGVAAGAGSVMASFNEIAGVPSHANRWLLTDVLRGEWHFDGMVVSDWAGIAEMVAHGRAATEAEAGRLALDAGVDMDMSDSVYLAKMTAGYGVSGPSRAALDEAVRRVLRAKYRLGLFRDPYRGTSPAREQAATLTPAHLALARESARRSMVLLKNGGGVLPLRRDLASLAVIGALADDSASMIGPWGGMGQAADVVTMLQGIRRAVSPQTHVVYAPGAAVLGSDTSGFAAAEQAARGADAVVLVVGESAGMSGEASSRAELGLPGVQQQLADRILATGKPVVVLLANGRPLAIPELAATAPAILETWFLGVQAGTAVADVLFGDVAPGGKLPVTFPRTVGQVPLYYNHKSTGRPADASNHYTSKYLDVDWTPLFPFGHGLSYTTFAYGPLRLSATSMGVSDTLVARVDVSNSGSRAGDEVVQLYIQDEDASITRPVKELRGFSRIALAPGQTRTVSFRLTADDLSFWGPAMKRIVEPGFFRVYAGTSSEQVQEARFELKAAPRH